VCVTVKRNLYIELTERKREKKEKERRTLIVEEAGHKEKEDRKSVGYES
jgi:hypothetical protein